MPGLGMVGSENGTGWGAGKEYVPGQGHRLLMPTAPFVAETLWGWESPRSSMPGFPLLENGTERGPASRTARQRQDLFSRGPRHCLLETQHLRAPRSWTLLPGPMSSPGRSLCLPRPSVPSASARAPLAQLRRVTRGARLRRPPRAGAGGWDSGERAAWRRRGPWRAQRGPSPCRATRS